MRSVRYNRKTTPGVKGGKVLKKNNHQLTPRRGVAVDRQPPKKGFRHVVTKRDVLEFIEIIPDHHEALHGINQILLYGGSYKWDGLYGHIGSENSGCIWLSAWNRDLTLDLSKRYFNEHQSIFDRIGLKFERFGNVVTCWFDEPKAKAYTLVHVLIHEIGHHIDSRKKRFCPSGEPYAEHFAKRHEDEIWNKYVAKFGQP